jgi:hypothetical protein
VEKKDVSLACQMLRSHILGAGSSLVALLEEQRGLTRTVAAAR